jgi:hypothetical protein
MGLSQEGVLNPWSSIGSLIPIDQGIKSKLPRTGGLCIEISCTYPYLLQLGIFCNTHSMDYGNIVEYKNHEQRGGF